MGVQILIYFLFILIIRENKKFDYIAQQVEHNTFNVGVLGSNPNVVTTIVYHIIVFNINNKSIFIFNGTSKAYDKLSNVPIAQLVRATDS